MSGECEFRQAECPRGNALRGRVCVLPSLGQIARPFLALRHGATLMGGLRIQPPPVPAAAVRPESAPSSRRTALTAVTVGDGCRSGDALTRALACTAVAASAGISVNATQTCPVVHHRPRARGGIHAYIEAEREFIRDLLEVTGGRGPAVPGGVGCPVRRRRSRPGRVPSTESRRVPGTGGAIRSIMER